MDVGGLRVASIVERIDGPTNWTIERDVHVLILHDAGSFHWLETWLDGHRTALGDPLPDEIWLAPAGRRFEAAAKGGTARSIQVEIPAARLSLPAGARAVAAHQDRVMATEVRALLAGEAKTAGELVARLNETLERSVALPVQPAIRRRIDALMVSIQAQLEVQITVEDMAAETGMSVNSLISNFARATGRTPAQYVLRQRLRRACWFLANRPLSIAEIAFATGFSSHAHLCAVFRRKLAMSPGEWREFASGRVDCDG